MKSFICHNKADEATARVLATLLVQQGVDVWFDEWSLKPGDSITGGIEEGLSGADVFIVVWSANANNSNWVKAELGAILNRVIKEKGLRIIPLMLDSTPLPALISDHKGFVIGNEQSLQKMVAEITGHPPDREVARLIQVRLLDLMYAKAKGGDPLPYLVCPQCGSVKLSRFEQDDPERDDRYYVIKCGECNWHDSTEV